jgi:hypothetical protein
VPGATGCLAVATPRKSTLLPGSEPNPEGIKLFDVYNILFLLIILIYQAIIASISLAHFNIYFVLLSIAVLRWQLCFFGW